jgi:hypothetical protein
MSGVSPSDFRGFNYSGSWGTSGLDLWQHHDNGQLAVEVARGKRYFPDWNVCRWWLSRDAFMRNPERFLANFEAGLGHFARNGVQVMPVLFNRWRDPACDFGGVPLEHIIPGFSYFCPEGSFEKLDRSDADRWSPHRLFGDYLEAVVGGHATDDRIVAWDLCNEPLTGPFLLNDESYILKSELRWLTWCADVCRDSGATQAVTVGNIPHLRAVELTEPFTDLISFHPYYIPRSVPGESDFPVTTKAGFEGFLDDVAELGKRTGKGVVASETVWGANDDAERVEIIRYTLGEIVQRGIGFVVHALHHSLVADMHPAEYGPCTHPGRMEFIEADGSLRPGHEAFNEFGLG